VTAVKQPPAQRPPHNRWVERRLRPYPAALMIRTQATQRAVSVDIYLAELLRVHWELAKDFPPAPRAGGSRLALLLAVKLQFGF
jgi:hypothetical protein